MNEGIGRIQFADVQTRRNRARSSATAGPNQYRILRLELHAARRLSLLPACFPWAGRLRVQRLDPALAFFVADGGNHQQISRAGRGDIREPRTLGLVAQQFVVLRARSNRR